MQSRLAPLLPLLAVACEPPGSTDAPDTETVITETGTSWDGFRPDAFGPTDATFAVDAAGNATSWIDPDTGAPVPVTVTFLLASEDLAESCTVTFRHPGPIPPAGWAAGLPAWAAWELPADASAESDCAGLAFPPAWSEGAEAALRRWTWGFGLGDLDPAVDAEVRLQAGDDYAELAPYLVGGGFYWDGLHEIDDLPTEPISDWLDGWVDMGLAFAYEVDAGLVRQEEFGQPVPVEAAAVRAEGGVAPAAFELQQTALLRPASLLLTE